MLPPRESAVVSVVVPALTAVYYGKRKKVSTQPGASELHPAS